jgi:cadmium resistance protein CadD (predicted permease)
MDIAALIAWLVTALGGLYMLGIWLSHGGARDRSSHLPVPVVLGHFALAAIGLVVWIIHVITDNETLAWTAFGLLMPIALLGFVMLARWIPVHRDRTAAPAVADRSAPAERHFPVAVVTGHGLAAVVTLVLVLLTALGMGE